jgi:hypothetical protein
MTRPGIRFGPSVGDKELDTPIGASDLPRKFLFLFIGASASIEPDKILADQPISPEETRLAMFTPRRSAHNQFETALSNLRACPIEPKPVARCSVPAG